jgi:hypothetical protein
MSKSTDTAPLSRVAQIAAFTTVGTLGITQDITHALLRDIGDMEGADPELVAEETLCLVATATARAAQVGLKAEPERASVAHDTLLNLPYTYRDYLIGSAMVAEQDKALAEMSEAIYERLQRKMQFYTTHLPADQFPGPHALKDKMALWMGRVSPPKLPESPQERLEKLELVDMLLTHVKLVLAFGRRGNEGSSQG